MEEISFKQKAILVLLNADAKKPMSPIQIMKSLFIYSKEDRPKKFYKFKPYLYGPCSLEVYSDLRKLISEGFITAYSSFYSWSFYRITTKGEKLLIKLDFTDDKLKEIKKTVLSKSFIGLVKDIYSKYPKFAKHSIINKGILKNL